MKLKNRIALYFTFINTSVLFGVLCLVYFTFMKFLEADFFERLTDRTMVTANLYLEADEISNESLNKVRLQYLKKLNSEVIRIYNSNNKATFIGDSTQIWSSKVIENVRKNHLLKFKQGTRQVVGIYYKDNQGDFVIIASAIDQGSHDRLAKLLKIMVVIFIVITILMLLTSRWIAERILRPLSVFMKDVQQVGSRNLEFRVAESQAKDEINLLAKNFNNLMEELEQAFILQKTFVANASHELRTPVTKLIMNAELALSKERNIQEYQQVLNSVLEDADKMEHIIQALLTIARMDLELINSQLSKINIETILSKCTEEWQLNKTKECSFINLLNQPVFVQINPVLFKIAVDNLLSNAFKFSKSKVSLTLRKADNLIYLDITDDGDGVSQDDIQEIFKPFFSRSKEIGMEGEGMGLYISSKIIDLFKGEILINQSTRKGCTFTIQLPEV